MIKTFEWVGCTELNTELTTCRERLPLTPPTRMLNSIEKLNVLWLQKKADKLIFSGSFEDGLVSVEPKKYTQNYKKVYTKKWFLICGLVFVFNPG